MFHLKKRRKFDLPPPRTWSGAKKENPNEKELWKGETVEKDLRDKTKISIFFSTIKALTDLLRLPHLIKAKNKTLTQIWVLGFKIFPFPTSPPKRNKIKTARKGKSKFIRIYRRKKKRNKRTTKSNRREENQRYQDQQKQTQNPDRHPDA